MMLVVLIGWVFFRIENFSEALDYIGKLFGGGASSDVFVIHFLDRERIIILGFAALSSSTFFLKLKNFGTQILGGDSNIAYKLISGTILTFMLLYSILLINSGSYNPFIYFRF